MSGAKDPMAVHTRIWQEIAHPDNAFITETARCYGYDVYRDLLGKISWVEMLYLLFRGAAPSLQHKKLLETLAVALMNLGPRHPGVHIAMSGGVTGIPSAAILSSALAVFAGQVNGAREVNQAMEQWTGCGINIEAWQNSFTPQKSAEVRDNQIWPHCPFPPGFDSQHKITSPILLQALEQLADISPGACLPFLKSQRSVLETLANSPINWSMLAAAAFTDLEFSPETGEMLFLLLTLPGAAAHGLEQRGKGYKNFPFGQLELE